MVLSLSLNKTNLRCLTKHSEAIDENHPRLHFEYSQAYISSIKTRMSWIETAALPRVRYNPVDDYPVF